MAAHHFLRNFLLGKERIVSRNEYKEALLRGQFGLLIGAICLVYIIIDSYNGIIGFIPFYYIGIVASILIVFLNRNRKSTSASITILVFSNLLVYSFAAIDSRYGGVFLYFASTASAALILFARHKRYIGYLFASVSVLLGIFAYLSDWSPISPTPFTETYTLVSFIINYTVAMLACIMTIYFAISRNNDSEKSLMNNIQARELAEQALLDKNEELQKANKELDRFVYSASHDMRAPLSSLLGLLEIMRLTNKDTELSEYFLLMKKGILTMEGFIKEVTDYSRNSRTEIAYVEIDLYSLVKGIIDGVVFSSSKTKTEGRINFPENFKIFCDVARIKVILNNLISNCFKYSDPIKTNNFFSIEASVINDDLILVIADNGIGIESEYQDRIFEMFYRATEHSDGSGLGLYIVKETVHKLGGAISFESEYMKGSKFTVRLPNKVINR
ncbi:MAG: HAMP domain-containing histidine kinase [Cyclobacteriaceae bacterium]|nr:HAMP domain-containing histidine kinase [Cyclobacteriaceae bacterium]